MSKQKRSAISDTWEVRHAGFDRARAGHEATVFTTANGYFATRGTHPEHDAGLPATMIAGVFTNDSLGFRTLVSCGKWLNVQLEVDGKRLRPDVRDVEEYSRSFDLRRGVVSRRLVWRVGRKLVTVETAHFCSLATRQVGWQRYQVRVDGAAARVRLVARVTTRVKTRGEYLLTEHRRASASECAVLTARTVGGDYDVAMAGHVRSSAKRVERKVTRSAATWELSTRLADGSSVTLDKCVAFATSRDTSDEPATLATEMLRKATKRGFDAEQRRHVAQWRKLWKDAAIEIDGDDECARGIHFVTAQLLSHAPIDDRAGLGAKPLSAEGYRGHVFWDTDLFMTPAITALRPALGRYLINYRYETLDGARHNAAKWGYRGAWYPWESAEEGTEVTPEYWLHADGRRMPITCWKHEIHSVCGVAQAVWDFYLATGDRDWLFARGAEILIETARYWASRGTYNEAENRFEIYDVCGPDECHERTDNCAYINVLAQRNVQRALHVLEAMRAECPEQHRELTQHLGFGRDELAELRRVAERIYVPQDTKTGWYRQFDGFENLEFIDPQTTQERFEEPPDACKTQVVKQADVIMLLYLLRHEHTLEQMRVNWDYYVPRTEHNTSLSAGTHAAVAARLGFGRTAVRYFRESVNMDLLDWRGDGSRGLHGAAMGGAICALLFGFGGVEFHEDHLRVAPLLPPDWHRLRMPFVYQGRPLELDIRRDRVVLRFREAGLPVVVQVADRRHEVCSDGELTIGLNP